MFRKLISFLLIASSWTGAVRAQQTQGVAASRSEVADAAVAGPPALTIYNQNFAVVRNGLSLALSPGVNAIRFSSITAHMEPDSVMLRDPLGTHALQVLEQNYRADPITQELLLSLYEGKTIDFLVPRGDHNEIVKGKIIRAGYFPRYGGRYNDPYVTASSQPIIEVDGTLRFSLPGQPLFPALSGDVVLKPSLNWLMRTDKPGRFDAELSYVTSGLSWEASYNLVVPEKGDVLEMVGWVTITNNSGTAFENANIKLLAGDVMKIQPGVPMAAGAMKMASEAREDALRPTVTERSFDEYHIYTMERPSTLHDQETKQLEFVRGTGVKSKRLYVYDGANLAQYGYYSPEQARSDPNYGQQVNKKVWVMQEFMNSRGNGLGIALPRGRVRFYRRDTDGHLEFTGENVIDHTARDERIRLYTGNSFDLVGERKRTNYKVNSDQNWMDESFEIHLRNHKKEAVEMRVVEHLYRWTNWQITKTSDKYEKTDSKTIEYRVMVPPDGEKTVTYAVHYSW